MVRPPVLPTVTFSAAIALTLGIGVAIFLVREPLLRIEYGTHVVLLICAAALYAAAVAVEILCWQQLSLRILVGIPEVAPAPGEARLLREGIYARIRHPRYAAWMLGQCAAALLVNYLAVYVLTVLFLPAMLLVAILEERELRERFGDAYAAYQEHVPRFIPRLRHLPASQGRGPS